MVDWPTSLWLVRHGESEGNIANANARRTGADRLDIDVNDIEVPLSELGRQQAESLGRWFGRLEEAQRPTVAVVSPYRRAQQTAALVLEYAGWPGLPIHLDERLRDREQGWLDRLTAGGVRASFPEESERRRHVGKFWYRPPGGESWADVAARIRAVLFELRLTLPGERVLVVTHDVPLLLVRYVMEALSADEAVALSGIVRNCSVTTYEATADGMALRTFNDVTALEQDDEAVVTAHE